MVLTAADTPIAVLAKQLQAAQGSPREKVFKYEQGRQYVLAWKESEKRASQSTTSFRDEGVYLITGGMGGLGSIFAREIAQRVCNPRLILTGRSILDARRRASLAELLSKYGSC